MQLRHVIITRFNLATPGREAAHRARPGWLEERFDLFERYCLPGVAEQSCQNFDWIVYFDEHTPQWARDRAEALQAVRPFHACYTGLFDADGWARTVRGTVLGPPVKGRTLITSNLDSDDVFGRDYAALVQATARSRDGGSRFAINLPDGYVLAGKALYDHRHLQNAFTNLVEPDDEAFATTMTIRHMELSDHVPVIQAEGPGAWLQVVHDGNVSNRIRGRRCRRDKALGHFPAGLLDQVRNPSMPAVLFEGLVAAPLRTLRDTAFATVRKVVRVD